MKLSDNFTLAELTKSQAAERYDISNEPGPQELKYLVRVAEEILQPVRNHFRIAFTPSSGFRCLELNNIINGSPTSQHVKGQAVDFEVPGVDNLRLAQWIRDNLDFDQLILEYYTPGEKNSGWIHCSISDKNRREVLTKSRSGYMRGLPE